jgi:hypothetical protein
MPAIVGRKWSYIETRDGIDGLVCTKCLKFKTIDSFHKHNGSKRGTRPDCIECNSKANKAYYEREKEKILERTRAYNKTEFRRSYSRKYQAARWRRIAEQKASRPRPMLCEVCNSPGDERGIVFDHCHDNGHFRGWLCNRCNRVLGMCADDPTILRSLALYIEKDRQWLKKAKAKSIKS